MISDLQDTLSKLRDRKPLVLCITNYVTMDFVANVLLALGAAPVMSVCEEELEELIYSAHSVSLNIGTLNPAFIELCHKAAELAKKI